MNITRLELLAKDLQTQKEFYSNVLDLSVNLTAEKLEVQIDKTVLIFNQASLDFNGAYHFAFNIPDN